MGALRQWLFDFFGVWQETRWIKTGQAFERRGPFCLVQHRDFDQWIRPTPWRDGPSRRPKTPLPRQAI